MRNPPWIEAPHPWVSRERSPRTAQVYNRGRSGNKTASRRGDEGTLAPYPGTTGQSVGPVSGLPSLLHGFNPVAHLPDILQRGGLVTVFQQVDEEVAAVRPGEPGVFPDGGREFHAAR